MANDDTITAPPEDVKTMDAAHKEMLTDSIVDKIMLLERTAESLKTRVSGQALSDDEQKLADAEMGALRGFVGEVSKLSALKEFDAAQISAVYERLEAVVERADSFMA
jgi:hypothetical protein